MWIWIVSALLGSQTVIQIAGRADLELALFGYDGGNGDTETRLDDITAWDVTSVTDMSELFEGKVNFDGDISQWNVIASTANT